MTVSDLLQQRCNKSDNAIKLVISCWQLDPNLLQQLGTSSANTTCRQLVNRFVTTCLQTCNNLCVFTCVLEFLLLMRRARCSHICASDMFCILDSAFYEWLVNFGSARVRCWKLYRSKGLKSYFNVIVRSWCEKLAFKNRKRKRIKNEYTVYRPMRPCWRISKHFRRAQVSFSGSKNSMIRFCL
jgi:hypothetical protein